VLQLGNFGLEAGVCLLRQQVLCHSEKAIGGS
jgi:hypothetical protein